MTTTYRPGPAVDGTGWHLGLGNPFFDVTSAGARGDGTTDDTAAIQTAVTRAEVAGGIVYLPAGTYMVSSPITVSSHAIIQGAGPNDFSTSGQTMIKVLASASAFNFPAGSGVLALTGTRCTVRDLSLNGNGVAVNELSMTHAEGTVRHLIENVSMLNRSTGPELYNIGCEDCTWVKCTISGSEATPASLQVGAVIQAVSGLATFVGCDFFCPVIFNAETVAWFGGNLGGAVVSNAGGAQSRQIGVWGAWVYDGGTPYTFCPVDCCYFSTTGVIAGGSLGKLDDANAAFTATDVGKDIVVFGAGPSGGVLSTTIATDASGTEITLTVPASQAGTYAYYLPGGTTAGGSGMYLCSITLDTCHVDNAVVQNFANGILPSVGKLVWRNCLVSRLAGNSTGASSPSFLFKTYSGTSDVTHVVDGVNYAQSDGSHIGIRIGGAASMADDVRNIQAPGSNVVQQNALNPTVSVPASTTAQTNVYGVPMIVTVTGGTVTVIAVNGVTTGLTSGSFLVPSGGTITLTYSVAPTWTWTQFSAYAAAPSASGTVTGPDAYGASAVVGTAATFSRGDHDHGLPAAPAVSLGSAESYISSNVTFTNSSTAYDITSVSLAEGTWLVTARAFLHDTNVALGGVDLWIGPNSASVTGAYASTTETVGDIAGGLADASVSIVKVVTLASPTTVYFSGLASVGSSAVVVYHQSLFESIGNVSGITAVQIA